MLREVEQSLAALAKVVPSADVPTVSSMHQLCSAMAGFSEWVVACAAGDADADRHQTAALTAVAIAQEILSKVHQENFKESTGKALDALARIGNVTNVGPALKSAALIPFPPCLVEHKVQTIGGKGIVAPTSSKKSTPSGPFALRVMLTVDGRPWANPQMLHPSTVYDVAVVANVHTWPEGSDTLVLDYITTLPNELYRISRFSFPKPNTGEDEELRAKGHIEFQSSQSFLSDPALLQMRATFRSSTDEKVATPATVIGYHKLLARIMDSKQSPHLSKYRALDLKLVEIIDQIRDLPGLDSRHLEDFVTVLAVVANYLGMCAQTAIYRAGEKFQERDFQKQVLMHLRGQLGEDVQEAPKQGAGITDIKFRSVTIELKVEATLSDRGEMASAYENQTTQYSSSLGAQLGILCVLDLTEKDAPSAPTQNNLIVMTPKLHGFGDKPPPSPSRVVAAIIDGNLRPPSSYSR